MKLKNFCKVFPETQQIEVYQMTDSVQTLYHGDCKCPHVLQDRNVMHAYFTDKLTIEISDIQEELGED